jgi:hypothetical protein
VGEGTGFDDSVLGEPSVEISTAAFRFDHTRVSSSIDFDCGHGTDKGSIALVLSRFSSGFFRAMFAMKEIKNGNEIHRRISA